MKNDTESLYRKYSEKADALRQEVARLERELLSSRDRLELVTGMLADMQALRGRDSGRETTRDVATVAAAGGAPSPVLPSLPPVSAPAASPAPAKAVTANVPAASTPAVVSPSVAIPSFSSPASRPTVDAPVTLPNITTGAAAASSERATGARRGGPGRPRGSSKAASRAARMDAISGGDAKDLSIVDAAVEYAKREGVTQAKAGDVHGWFEKYNYQSNRGTGVPNRNSIYVSLNREAGATEKDPQRRVEKVSRGEFRFNHGSE